MLSEDFIKLVHKWEPHEQFYKKLHEIYEAGNAEYMKFIKSLDKEWVANE